MGVVTVTGRDRRLRDVSSELMEALADEPRVVVCDLTGAIPSETVAEDLAPVADYLARWPGTVVMMSSPDQAVRAAALGTSGRADWWCINASWSDGDGGVHRLLPALERRNLRLSPLPTACRDARAFVSQTLLDWDLSPLVDAAIQVASVIVTNALTHAPSLLDLHLSQVEDRVRVAVRDHGVPPGSEQPESPDAPALGGRGLKVMQTYADGWGVIPASTGGKTAWAVLDTVSATASAQTYGRAEPPAGRHRGAADRDVLAELHSGAGVGRHRRDVACEEWRPELPGAG